MMRDVELELLKSESDKFLEKLTDTKRKIPAEEIDCFKKIVSLQRRLIQEDDQPGD